MKGDEETLSNLVCSIKDSFQCINPSIKKVTSMVTKTLGTREESLLTKNMGFLDAKRKTDQD